MTTVPNAGQSGQSPARSHGSRVARVVLVCLLLGGLQALFSSGAVNPYFVRIVNLCCFSVMLAVSLNIINGYAGQFSLGHAGFYAVGAYTSAALTVYGGGLLKSTLGLAALPVSIGNTVALLVAVVFGAFWATVAGLVVGLPSLRLRGDYLAIATLGFGEMIRVLTLNTKSVGGALGFNGIPMICPFFWIGLFTVGTVWIARNLLNSRQGRALLALRDDETAASVLGINVTRHKVAAFLISSALAGCAGALYAHFDGYLSPDSFNFLKSIDIVIMVILGGMGSTTGAILAAIVLTVLPESLREFQDYRMVVYSALLIIVMLVRPQGLLGTREFSWAGLKRRLEARHGAS